MRWRLLHLVLTLLMLAALLLASGANGKWG